MCHTQNHQVSYLKIAEKWWDQKYIVVNCCNFKPLFRSDSAVHVDLLISASFSSTKPLAKNSPLARLKSQFTRPALGRKNLLGLFENVMVRKLPHENCHCLLKNTFLDKPNMPKVPGVLHSWNYWQIAGHLDIKACTNAKERSIARKEHANFTQKEAMKSLSPVRNIVVGTSLWPNSGEVMSLQSTVGSQRHQIRQSCNGREQISICSP